ncbi:endonuclease VII domain-containing protein [Streptomyces sp. NPDC059009]|uniref:endonuclease VII domain-containing protein n=1 Tax=Streptomyces sp. NPDC059009 TaxID=3346694 RepID=UPI00369BACE6
MKICKTCATEFYAAGWQLRDVQRNQGAYCSRECKSRAQEVTASKVCTKCLAKKPLDQFPPNKKMVTGRASHCHECMRAATAKWRAENAEHYEELKKSPRTERQRLRRFELDLWQKYGITLEEYEAMQERQNNVCAICEGPPRGRGADKGRFHVDHCHATGKVRGLLCSPCNTAIGLLEDDAKRAMRVAQYLEET